MIIIASNLFTSVNDALKGIGEYLLAPISIGFLTYFVVQFRKWLEKRSYKWKFKHSSEKNERINNLLTEIRIKLGCERAYLSFFHNGKMGIDGSEIFFETRLNESLGFGVASDSDKYSQLPVGLMLDEIELAKQDGPSFTLTSSLKDGKFRRLLNSSGIHAIARCAVKNGTSLIGSIGVDFPQYIDKAPENIQDLVTYSGIIEQVLNS